MSYDNVLEAVARLHVDLRFRQAFSRDAAAALAPLDLLDYERRALAGIAPAMLARLARIADHHRVARIREQLGWVDFTRRPDLYAAVARYMIEVPPRLLNRDEAVAFCLHLESGAEASPPYLPELARYDRLRISLAWGLDGEGRTRRVERFAYPVLRIVAELDEPGWPDVAQEPEWIELKKVPRLPAVVVRRAPPPPVTP
jgi:hypothetical protein